MQDVTGNPDEELRRRADGGRAAGARRPGLGTGAASRVPHDRAPGEVRGPDSAANRATGPADGGVGPGQPPDRDTVEVEASARAQERKKSKKRRVPITNGGHSDTPAERNQAEGIHHKLSNEERAEILNYVW